MNTTHTPAALNKLIQQKANEYIQAMQRPAPALSPRMRAMLAQPGCMFKRQAE